MRYRKLDANGDYTFGNSAADMLINTPETVGQAIDTRLGLFVGEWFADTADGTDWFGKILGHGATELYALELRQRVLETPGVTRIISFTPTFDPNKRQLDVEMFVDTQYGQTSLTGSYAR